MQETLRISVTIATFNRCLLLEKSLQALAHQSLPSSHYEIIICDSNSDDGTSEMIRSFSRQFPELKIRHLHTSNILAAKRNLGVQEAFGDIVIFFDDDCVADRDCLLNYYKFYTADSCDKVIYCGEVRFPEDWVTTSNYYRFRDSRHFGKAQREDLRALDFRTIVVMNMAFRRKEFLENIGAVDESFIGYGCEDQDLGWRLQKMGFKIKKADAKIIHYEGSSDIVAYSKKIFHAARDGMTTLLEKNPEAVKALGLRFQLLDAEFPELGNIKTAALSLLRGLIFPKFLEKIVSFWLVKSDRFELFYSPFLFRYVLACAYVRGTKCRSQKLQTSGNWYE